MYFRFSGNENFIVPWYLKKSLSILYCRSKVPWEPKLFCHWQKYHWARNTFQATNSNYSLITLKHNGGNHLRQDTKFLCVSRVLFFYLTQSCRPQYLMQFGVWWRVSKPGTSSFMRRARPGFLSWHFFQRWTQLSDLLHKSRILDDWVCILMQTLNSPEYRF